MRRSRCARTASRPSLVNCNPEGPSRPTTTPRTRLYFEPLTLEDVLEVIDKEKPEASSCSTAARRRYEAVPPALGGRGRRSSARRRTIDVAEDRERFQKLVAELGTASPRTRRHGPKEQVSSGSREVGFPLVVRPSYVLSGRAMIVFNEEDLQQYMTDAVKVSNSRRCCSTGFRRRRHRSRCQMPSATASRCWWAASWSTSSRRRSLR
ncbi:MAG: hypothetical protein R3E65_05760 [Steroidobacteraceae bacterium]